MYTVTPLRYFFVDITEPSVICFGMQIASGFWMTVIALSVIGLGLLREWLDDRDWKRKR